MELINISISVGTWVHLFLCWFVLNLLIGFVIKNNKKRAVIWVNTGFIVLIFISFAQVVLEIRNNT